MITPPYLKAGDKVGIVATARKVSAGEIESGLRIIKEWGFEPVVGKNLFSEHFQLAGKDEERVMDLQQMLDDPEIKAIFFARGGYGTVRIVDNLDFTTFQKNPKWIAGYSDITVLHNHIHKLGIETIHSVMVSAMKDKNHVAVKTLYNSLTGDLKEYTFPSESGFTKSGIVKGILTGGNLSLLFALSGSSSEVRTEGKILFIEDLDEYLYHVDRMMINLKRAGQLKNLKGLIVGGMTEMKDNPVPYGYGAEEIIADAVREYNYPVCFDFPAGHIDNNHALILGREVELNISDSTISLKF